MRGLIPAGSASSPSSDPNGTAATQIAPRCSATPRASPRPTPIGPRAEGHGAGYVVEDAEGEEIDACWGYLGDYETSGCLEEGRIALAHRSAQAKAHQAEADNGANAALAASLEASRPGLYAGPL